MAILVNGQRVEDEVIRSEAGVLKDRLTHEFPGEDSLMLELRAREWARENVIRDVVLRQAAGEKSPDELLRTLTEKVPRPKKQEIAAYYRQFQSLFHAPDLMRAAHIVKNIDEAANEAQAEAAIRDIEARLQNGADFGELADCCSDCPGQGGDLGFFAAGEMVDEFEAAIAMLAPGDTTGIFRSVFGFHIAKLIERRPGGLRSLNEARGQIEEQIWNQRKRHAIDEYIDRLRARAEVRKA